MCWRRPLIAAPFQGLLAAMTVAGELPIGNVPGRLASARLATNGALSTAKARRVAVSGVGFSGQFNDSRIGLAAGDERNGRNLVRGQSEGLGVCPTVTSTPTKQFSDAATWRFMLDLWRFRWCRMSKVGRGKTAGGVCSGKAADRDPRRIFWAVLYVIASFLSRTQDSFFSHNHSNKTHMHILSRFIRLPLCP
jgi:hypothetical protein